MPIHDFVQKLKANQDPVPDGDSAPLTDPADRLALTEAMADYQQEMAPDPKPARRSAPRARKNGPAPKVTAKIREEVADGITMMITMPAGIWSFRDPVCGGALLEHGENIAAKLTPIVCRNPALLAWFTEGAAYMDWFALFTALAPVARTIWDHHVVHPRTQDAWGEDPHAGPDDHGATGPADYAGLFSAPAFPVAA